MNVGNMVKQPSNKTMSRCVSLSFLSATARPPLKKRHIERKKNRFYFSLPKTMFLFGYQKQASIRQWGPPSINSYIEDLMFDLQKIVV
jgi:hypothetical protein